VPLKPDSCILQYALINFIKVILATDDTGQRHEEFNFLLVRTNGSMCGISMSAFRLKQRDDGVSVMSP
jgi:hypothetical protein